MTAEVDLEEKGVSPLGTLWDRAGPVGRVLGAVDDAGERWSAGLSGRRWADLGAAVVSNLSDHGAVWVLAAAWKARRPGPRRRRAVATLALAGITSYGVNRAVKRAAGRDRPPVTGLHRAIPVRSPASSSFPSGHTLASFCTAVVLPDDEPARGAALVFACAVAASRVHLREHHLSDVLGGALVGAALGTVVRRVLDALAPETGLRPRRLE